MSTDSVDGVRTDTPAAANGHAPDWLREAHLDATITRSVADLCEEFRAVCESAVDPLEVASALEFSGFNDHSVKDSYGVSDVFALARAMYLRVPRRPADPEPVADPWTASRWRPLLHGLLYALPAVCFPAAGGLLGGPGVKPSLVTALLIAWGLSQGLASIGYVRRVTAGEGEVRWVLRAGLAVGVVLVTLAMLAAGLVFDSHPLVLFFGAGEGAYMLGACVLMVLEAEAWIPVALAPGVGGSAVFLALGRPSGLEHLTWVALAATPVVACGIAVALTRAARPRGAPLLVAAELRVAGPAVAFGVIAAGLLIFPVAVGPEGHGGLNVGALLAALPLSLSMGAAEWTLLWYRRHTRSLLGSVEDLREFGRRSRLDLLAAVLQYLFGTAILIAGTVAIAIRSGLAHPNQGDLPEMAAYLMLGTAMFLALLLQTMRLRAVPILVAGGGLVTELVLRDTGMAVQVLVPAVMLLVIGAYALITLGEAVRHG